MQTELEPSSGLNIFWGPNGSGKTAVLEAVHILSRTRSFRTSKWRDTPRYGTQDFHVIGHVSSDHDGQVITGISRQGPALRIRYRGDPVKRISTHTRRFPVTLAITSSEELIYGPPKSRRKWMDWGLFHVEPDYPSLFIGYHIAIHNRNYLLSNGTGCKEIEIFERQTGELSQKIKDVQHDFIRLVRKHLDFIAKEMGVLAGSLQVDSGWAADSDLAEILRQSRVQDGTAGYARSGSHCADLRIEQKGRPRPQRCRAVRVSCLSCNRQ